ncbi:MAG TPA: VWA domain-containing protein [Stellaceae bacterium]
MSEPLLRFLRAARSAGVRISPAESIDAARTVEIVGYADRGTLKDSLALVLAKTEEEKRRFEECFDLYFSRDGFRDDYDAGVGADTQDVRGTPRQPDAGTAPPPPGEGGAGVGGGTPSPLAGMLLEGDRAGLAAAMEEAAAAAGLANIVLFTQVNLFARRIMDRMGMQALEDEIAALRRDSSDDAAAERARRLQRGKEYLADQVRDLAQQYLLLFAQGESERRRDEVLAQVRLSNLDRRDLERMRILVRAMARRLATRYGRNRRRRRRGQLDARRTLRRNMGWGGVPFLTVWKQRKIEKPRVMALCDVSGSVAALAQFLLLFLYALTEALSDIRSFAFAGDLIEVSEILEREPIETAIATIMDRIGYGSSNYGNALADFEKGGWLDAVDARTTIIILGDGRGNRTEPRVDIVRRISERAKQVIWLNPEHPNAWGTGDSDMLRYAPYCRITTVCNTVRHIERVVSDLLRNNG